MALETKRFSKNDDSFTCAACGFSVLPLGYSSRNHCPRCLASLHVDILPGDRANPCCGIMDAVAAEVDAKKGYVLFHRCRRCGEVHRNRTAHSARIQPDDLSLIIALTAKRGDLR